MNPITAQQLAQLAGRANTTTNDNVIATALEANIAKFNINTPLRFAHVDQMIQDNNKSRVHLGVHWNFDCELGARSGARVADAVYQSCYRKLR